MSSQSLNSDALEGVMPTRTPGLTLWPPLPKATLATRRAQIPALIPLNIFSFSSPPVPTHEQEEPRWPYSGSIPAYDQLQLARRPLVELSPAIFLSPTRLPLVALLPAILQSRA